MLAVISKIYSHISLSQKNKIKLTAFNVATKPTRNRAGISGWCQGMKCHAEIQDIECLFAALTWSH